MVRPGAEPWPGAVCDGASPRHAWRTVLLARTLLAAAPPGAVVDAGCGAGTLALLLAAAGREVIAFDLDPDRVATARSRARSLGLEARIRFVRADATSLPLADGSVQGAVAGEVLEHLSDDAAAASELARVIAPGGALAITVPAGASRLGPTDHAVGHVRRYDRGDLARPVTKAGFELEILRGWGFPFGRIYDRLVLRPAVGARGSEAGRWLGWLGQRPLVRRAWGLLFAADERLPAGSRGSGWLAVARRPAASRRV